VLAIILTVSSSNLGAADFVSLHAGSWFDAASTWGQSSNPGNGDNVEISAAVDYVVFDPSTSGLSVTISNLYLYNGTLWVDSSPIDPDDGGTNSLFSGNCFLNGVSGVLHNQGTVFQSSAGPLNIGNQTTFENEIAGTYNLEGDSGVTGFGLLLLQQLRPVAQEWGEWKSRSSTVMLLQQFEWRDRGGQRHVESGHRRHKFQRHVHRGVRCVAGPDGR